MATTALKLPSTLQVVVVKPVSMTLVLGLFTLALLGTSRAQDELPTIWETPPMLETFASYEDMQYYFDHRNQRSLRHIENPLKDSYIEAFNQHNEQEDHRTKRAAASEQQELEHQPALIKFEMADAVEPSDEVKQLIRQYKSRQLQQNEKYLETVSLSNVHKPENYNKTKVKRTSTNVNSRQAYFGKRLSRSKRSTHHQLPTNFKVKYIPFEVTDAREPDIHTKNLIKRMRALEIEKLSKELPSSEANSKGKMEHIDSGTTTTKKPFTKRSKFGRQWKPKRIKRDVAAPEMIKFEISDAKDPDPALKNFIKTKKDREAKDLKLESTTIAITGKTVDAVTGDQNAQDTKRYFVYKEAPVKVKKSVAAIPHDVQNIISHLIKGGGGGVGGGGGGGGGGKANLKYIPAQQIDYNNLKAAYQNAKGGGPIYGHGAGGGGGGGLGYGKYVHAVPVKFVYHQVAVAPAGGHGGGYEGGGGGGGAGGHEAGGAAVAVPVKYVAVGGGGGHGYAVGGGGGYDAGGVAVKYVDVAGGEGGGYGGGYGGEYAGGYGAGGGYKAGGEAAGGEAAGGEYGEGGGQAAQNGGGKDGNVGGPVAAAEAGYSAEYAGGGYGGGYAAMGGGGAHGGGYVAASEAESSGGGYAAAGAHGGGYGLVHGGGIGAHANYAGYGGEQNAIYPAAHAPAAIVHPIVVAEGGGGQAKGVNYGAEGAGVAEAKNAGNEVIKNIPAPQFKGEVKYSVVPTVEQYAKTPTQDFHLKLYSPESLIAKAQLEAKDKAKAIAEEGQKAVAAAYKQAAEKAKAGFGGGYGGGKGANGGGAKEDVGYGGAEGGFGFKILGGGLEGGKGGGYIAGDGGVGYDGGKGGAGLKNGGAGPVIKIEYHAPAESLKGNYKDFPEFHQLSTLVGKSPEDQIHGLTYLLAKEMQNRLHFQRQHNFGGGGGGGGKGAGGYGVGKGIGGGYGGGGGEGIEARPQDNKAPILFHPEEAPALGGAGEGGKGGGGGGGGGFYQPIVGKYMAMAKSKQYIPVIENAAAEEYKGAGAGAGGEGGLGAKVGAGEGGGGGGKLAGNAYGLSPNYKGLGGFKGFAGGMGIKAAAGSGGGGDEVYNAKSYEEAAAKLQSYASKYAFGYRIRDFNTGNDFGHKQDRDLHGVTRGQYHILLPDGRIQNVIYHADDTGFHADVSFESGR